MPKFILFICISLMPFANIAIAKDKSVANQYPVILEVNKSGKVVKVVMQDYTPAKIKQKAEAAFMHREIGIKRKFGKAIDYKQKITISTKHLIDKSQISKR